MSDASTCDDALQGLYRALGWSLLQYLGSADPWTIDAEARRTLDRLAATQRESFREVSDLLARRHLLPDRGGYPTAFTRLHFLSLDYLIDHLIADQATVVAAADTALAGCDRTPVTRALDRVAVRERNHLDVLRSLAEKPSPEPVV